jgi:hypothetical protein
MDRYLEFTELEKSIPSGAFSAIDMEVLVPEVEKLGLGNKYMEIGVDKGKSLAVARHYSKEGVLVCGADLKDDPKVPDTQFFKGHSFCVAQDWKLGAINLLFIDGDHTYEGCRLDIQSWLPYMGAGTVMLFHDCDETSPGVMKAVAEFVDESRTRIAEFKMFKRDGLNTSMAKVRFV